MGVGGAPPPLWTRLPKQYLNISLISFDLKVLKYLKRSVAKDCSEDGRGEEGDDGQEDRHAGCERERDFIVGELSDSQGSPPLECL